MKRLIAIALLAASLGGCVIAPPAPGYGYHRHYAEPPVVVVPGYRPAPPRPAYGWDYDRGREYGRRW